MSEEIQNRRDHAEPEDPDNGLAAIEPCYFPTLNDGQERGTDLRRHHVQGLSPSGILQFCHKHGVTVSAFLQTMWSLVLKCYTGSDSPCFGYLDTDCRRPIQGDIPVVCTLLSNSETALTVLRDVQENLLHRACSPNVNDSAKGLGQKIPFNTAMIVQRRGWEEVLEDVLDLIHLINERTRTDRGVLVNVSISNEGPIVDLEYQSSKISDSWAENLAGTFVQIISSTVEDPSVSIADLDTLSDMDRHQITTWNSTPLEPVDSCIHNIIEQQVQKRPNSPAICAWDGNLTYQELDDLSTRFSICLAVRGVGPESKVPICFEKSVWTTVAILGILKAGGAFVPLDPEQPTDRHKYIIHEIEASLIVTSQQQSPKFRDLVEPVILCSQFMDHLTSGRECNEYSVNPSCLAYIIFTSGSTGRPKGVLMEHRSFCSSSMGYGKALSLNEASRVLQFANYTFDATMQEILSTLMFGGCVCQISDTSRMNDLAGAINKLNANFAFFTPTMVSFLKPSDIPGLQTMVLGGEALTKEAISDWADTLHLIEGYGPAEAAVYATVKSGLHSKAIPGNVGSSTWVHTWLVDPSNSNRLASVGAIGEIWLEGPPIARGYLNDKLASETAFVKHPNWLQMDETYCSNRCYKTGDLGRYNADGSIQFLGRKDTQVKIRGQRMELGEVEHHLRQIFPSAMKIAAEVITSPSKRYLPKLVAFVEADDSLNISHPFVEGKSTNIDSLNSKVEVLLLDRLPKYMIPSDIKILDHFPRMSSGKLDRKALRRMGDQEAEKQLSEMACTSPQKAMPSTPREIRLQELWAKVLRLPPNTIGVNDDFIRLGGDSLSAMKLVAAARDQCIHLTVSNVFKDSQLGKMALVATMNKDAEMSDLRPFGLLEDAEQSIRADAVAACEVDPECIEDIYPCTPLQEGFISISTRQPGAYIAQEITSLREDVNMMRFQMAWKEVIATTPILRTRIVQTESHGMMQVVIKEDVEWVESGDLETYLREDRALPMLLGDRLSRHALTVDRASGDRKLVWTVHHALYDGWCLGLIRDTLYKAYLGQKSAQSPGFNRFIKYLSNLNEDPAKQFWKTHLAGAHPTAFPQVNTPDFYPQPESSTKREVNIRRVSQSRITTSILIQTAWAILVGLYTESKDVVFGTTLTGRTAPVPGIESIAGPTITTIPIRVQLGANSMNDIDTDGERPRSKRVKELLQEVQDLNMSVIPYQHIGLRNIQLLSKEAQEACDFKSLIVVQPSEEEAESQNPFAGKYASDDFAGLHTYSLLLNCTLHSSGVEILASYDARVMKEVEVERLLQQFDHLLQQICLESDIRIDELDLISSEEELYIKKWNSDVMIPIERCIHSIVEYHVQQQPDAPAVCSWDGNFTYSELDQLSTRLANHIVDRGVSTEMIVPLAFEKSKWTIVGMLAVLKAGGAFVLLDMAHPSARLKLISEKVKAKIILASCTGLAKIESFANSTNIVVVEEKIISQLPTSYKRREVFISAGNAAYVMFTSGSTGEPKGCVIEHGSYCTAAAGHGKAMGMSRKSRSLQFASYSFAAAIKEILTTLIFGGCVCVLSEEERMNHVNQSIQRMGVTWAFLTPSLLSVLDPESVPSLQDLSIGGESIRAAQIEAWADRLHLHHGWGTAECCGVVSSTQMSKSSDTKDIGIAVTGKCWVVDPTDHKRLMALGAVGELIVEGRIVGRGYIDEPKNNAAAFITPPLWRKRFGPVSPSSRFYKSGDLARYTPHGLLQYMGRKDTQIKLNGQRIEIGEVEYLIKKITKDQVDVAVELVIPRGGKKESAVIAAFFALKDAFDGAEELSTISRQTKAHVKGLATEIVGTLRELLPTYMVPTVFIPLRKLPMTVSGKLYRKRLRELASELSLRELTAIVEFDHEKRVPSSEIEESLQGLWAEVLNLKREDIGLDDSFFQLGGDSIGAMRLVSALGCHGLRLTVTEIFRGPRLFQMARFCADTTKLNSQQDLSPFELLENKEAVQMEVTEFCSLEAALIEDIYPCTPIQEDLVILSSKEIGAYVAQLVLKLSDDTDIERFRKAWEQTVSENCILRTRIFVTESSGSVQIVDKEPVSWASAEDLDTYLEQDRYVPMTFGDRLNRSAIIQNHIDGSHNFVMTIHHAIFDGWSLPLTFKRLYDNYQKLPSAPAPAPDFKQYVHFLSGQDNDASNHYWTSYLDHASASSFPPRQSTEYESRVDAVVGHRIDLSRHTGSDFTISTTFRAAWAMVVSQYSVSNDVIFGSIHTGRNIALPGIERMMGPTATFFPVRVRLHQDQAVQDLLNDIQVEATKMIPFEGIGLRNIQRLNEDIRTACEFQNIMVIQTDSEMPSADDTYKFHTASDSLAEFHNYPLTVKCYLHGKDFLDVEAVHDSKLLNSKQTSKILKQFDHIIQQLFLATGGTKVADIEVGNLDGVTAATVRMNGSITPKPTGHASASATLFRSACLPSTPAEKIMAELWMKILDLPPTNELCLDDNFLHIGGDSVKAMQLVTAARKAQISLSVLDIYKRPKLSEMAAVAQSLQTENSTATHKAYSTLSGIRDPDKFLADEIAPQLSVQRSAIEDVLICTSFQQQMFAASLLQNRGCMYYFNLRFTGVINEARLDRACSSLIERHSILRTVFVPHKRNFLQVVLRPEPANLESKDIDQGDLTSASEKATAEDKKRGNFLTQQCLRFIYLKDGERSSQLIVRLSHAQFDGFSLPLIFQDLQTAYDGKLVLEYRTSFTDFIYATEHMKRTANALTFWSKLLDGASMTNIVALKKPSYQNYLDRKVSRKVLIVTWNALEFPTSDILKTAWAIVLAQFSKTADVLFGHTIANRNIPMKGIDTVIGPCVNSIPVRVKMQQDHTPTVRELLTQVHNQHLESIPYQFLPLNDIISECTPWPSWTRFSSTIVHQDLQKGSGSSQPLWSSALSVGGIQSDLSFVDAVYDIADVAIVSRPAGDSSDVLDIDLNFCEANVPSQLAEALAQKLCQTMVRLAGSLDAPYTSMLVAAGRDDLGSRNMPIIPWGPVQDVIPFSNRIVEEAWKSIIFLQEDDIDHRGPRNKAIASLERDVFDCGGDLVAFACLAYYYSQRGYAVRIEELIENPTMGMQMGLLSSRSSAGCEKGS